MRRNCLYLSIKYYTSVVVLYCTVCINIHVSVCTTKSLAKKLTVSYDVSFLYKENLEPRGVIIINFSTEAQILVFLRRRSTIHNTLRPNFGFGIGTFLCGHLGIQAPIV